MPFKITKQYCNASNFVTFKLYNPIILASENSIQQQLQEIFRKIFRDSKLIIEPKTTAADIPGWDSFTHIELITEVEKTFNTHFSFEEVMNLNCVGDMLQLIMKHK